MKEQDLREKFKRFVNGYVGSSMLTNTEYPETIEANATECVQIAIDYAREEATDFGAWFHKNYQNVGIQLYRKFGSWENVTIEEAYEIYLTTKTQNK